jgi:hypothetical protein
LWYFAFSKTVELQKEELLRDPILNGKGKCFVMNNQEDILTQRIQKIKDWAWHNDFSFREEDATGKTFTINGKNSGRLVSIYQNSKYKGEMYAYISDVNFPGDLAQRDVFVGYLKKINLLDKTIDISKVNSHRKLLKKLEDLTENELDNFLDLIASAYNENPPSGGDALISSRSYGDYLPTKDDVESAYDMLGSRGEEIDIDSILDQIDKNATNSGRNLKANWRLITEKNIEMWSKKKY